MCTLFAQLRRRRDTRARNHESKQIVQNTQKISTLKSNHPEKYLPNYPTQNIPE